MIYDSMKAAIIVTKDFSFKSGIVDIELVYFSNFGKPASSTSRSAIVSVVMHHSRQDYIRC